MTSEASEAGVQRAQSAGVDLVAMLPDHVLTRVQKRIAEDDSFNCTGEHVRRGRLCRAFAAKRWCSTSHLGLFGCTWPLASLHNLWNLPLLADSLRGYRRRAAGDAHLSIHHRTHTARSGTSYVTVSEVDKIEGAIKDAVSSAFAWQNPIRILFRGEARP